MDGKHGLDHLLKGGISVGWASSWSEKKNGHSSLLVKKGGVGVAPSYTGRQGMGLGPCWRLDPLLERETRCTCGPLVEMGGSPLLELKGSHGLSPFPGMKGSRGLVLSSCGTRYVG